MYRGKADWYVVKEASGKVSVRRGMASSDTKLGGPYQTRNQAKDSQAESVANYFSQMFMADHLEFLQKKRKRGRK